jgi:hypothetical protein
MAALPRGDGSGEARHRTPVAWPRLSALLVWRSRSRRRPIAEETLKRIRQMCLANPLWGAPRSHSELLKLGIQISQATVAKYVLRRPHSPSTTRRSFPCKPRSRHHRHRHAHRAFGDLPAVVRDAHTGQGPTRDCPLRWHRTSLRRLAVASSDRSVSVGPLLVFCSATATRSTVRNSVDGSTR